MADLSIRSEIRESGIIAKLIDEESIAVCSQFTPLQIKTWLQTNRPTLWNRIKDIYSESPVTPCPKDGARNHYTISW